MNNLTTAYIDAESKEQVPIGIVAWHFGLPVLGQVDASGGDGGVLPQLRINLQTADYVAQPDDNCIFMDTTGSASRLTLCAQGTMATRAIVIKSIGNHDLNVVTADNSLIDDRTGFALKAKFSCVMLVQDGTQYRILSAYNPSQIS